MKEEPGEIHVPGGMKVINPKQPNISQGGEMADCFRLGESQLYLSPVGLGTWQFSRGIGLAGKFWPALDDETIYSIIERAVGSGITWFDTAELYGNGSSERSISEGLSRLGAASSGISIATKWNPLFRRASHLKSSFPERKKALFPFTPAILQIHFPFGNRKKQLTALADLYHAGEIQAVGVSNFSRRQMTDAHKLLKGYGIPLASNQIKYNLINRIAENDGTLDSARERGISIIAYSPLEQGILTGKFHTDTSLVSRTPVMRRQFSRINQLKIAQTAPLLSIMATIGKNHGATPAQIALAWLISGQRVFVIPGATRPEQAESSAGAMNIQLSSEEINLLDHASHHIRG